MTAGVGDWYNTVAEGVKEGRDEDEEMFRGDCFVGGF